MIEILQKANRMAVCACGAALALCSFLVCAPETPAQAYPAKPIRIIVTGPPSSGQDIIARLLGSKLTEALGQQIIVDNRTGASGRIGAEVAARAAPDGYTLMLSTSQLAIVAEMYEDLKYDLAKDFAPISMVGTAPFILVINPSIPATSVKEFVALAKSKPGVLKYGTSGSGSPPHLSAEIFRFMTGIEILHVPYKGSVPALTNTMTGEVDMSFHVIPACLPMIKGGKLRALGVSSARRSPLVPDLPSLSESVPGYEFTGWYALVAPAKTPPAILATLNAEVTKALNAPVIRERMAGLGVEPLGSTPRDLAAYIRVQMEKMREAVKLSGARPEN